MPLSYCVYRSYTHCFAQVRFHMAHLDAAVSALHHSVGCQTICRYCCYWYRLLLPTLNTVLCSLLTVSSLVVLDSFVYLAGGCSSECDLTTAVLTRNVTRIPLPPLSSGPTFVDLPDISFYGQQPAAISSHGNGPVYFIGGRVPLEQYPPNYLAISDPPVQSPSPPPIATTAPPPTTTPPPSSGGPTQPTIPPRSPSTPSATPSPSTSPPSSPEPTETSSPVPFSLGDRWYHSAVSVVGSDGKRYCAAAYGSSSTLCRLSSLDLDHVVLIQ